MSWGRTHNGRFRKQYKLKLAKRLGSEMWEECHCVACDVANYNNQLEVHHIYPCETHPELAEILENGVPLCHNCHKLYHTLVRMSSGTKRSKYGSPDSLAEFLGLSAVKTIFPEGV